jgi:nucleotide-binding universal stress UspA family protein
MSELLKIVAPTDFSEQSTAALSWVKKLSDRGHAEVHCISVVQEPMMYLPVMVNTVAASMPDITELERITQELLDAYAEKNLGDLEVPTVTKVLTGRPAEEIVNYAKSIDAQMIVIATRGQSGLTHALMGSVAEGVVRQAECPVLTVRG